MWKKYNTDAERSEARNFFEKIKIRALKFIILLLNYTLGPPKLYSWASKSGGQGGVRAPGAPPPGSASDVDIIANFVFLKLQLSSLFTPTNVSK